MLSNEEIQAAIALKKIARDERIKSYIQQSPDLYPLLLRAAKRFVTGEKRQDGLAKAKQLMAKGYLVSLEHIGENTRSREDCLRAKEEFMVLIKEAGSSLLTSTISLDLSHIGLSLDPELAYQQLIQLVIEAKAYNLTIMISMEESTKTSQILDIYKRSVEHHSNIGITLQAHLNRTIQDINEIIQHHQKGRYSGKIRLVKGAYQEPTDIAISRSEKLNEKYLSLVERLVEAGCSISIATHDEAIIQEVKHRGYLNLEYVEVEMLYGIRPDLLRDLKDQQYKTRIYLTYGREWYLYVCHRLAEYPPNIYQAISDMVIPTRTDQIYY
jgi:proline dehydrogenase